MTTHLTSKATPQQNNVFSVKAMTNPTKDQLRAMLNGREAFEAWAVKKGYFNGEHDVPDSRNYHDEWMIWQAAWQARDLAIAYLLETVKALAKALENV